MSLPLMLALVPALIALNAFFVASEYALVASRPMHLEALRRRGRHRAAGAMERLKRDPASAIGAIQVCITVTNLALGWIGEPAMSSVLLMLLGPLAEAVPDAVFRPVSVVLSFLVVTLLTVVFSELLPKALTLRYVPPVVMFTAAPVVVIGQVVRPLVWLIQSRLGDIGEAGATVEIENVVLKVLRNDGRSIHRVEVRPALGGPFQVTRK